MARYLFGGGVADWTFGLADVSGADDVAKVSGGIEVTFWSNETGGVQYTDLLDASSAPATSVTSSTGSDGRSLGQIPPLWGPDGVTSMWASAAGGPRVLMSGLTGDALLQALAQAATNAANLSAHATSVNAHGTGFADLADVTAGTPGSRTTGYVITWDSASQRFVLTAPAASTGALLLNPPAVGGTYVGNVATPPDPAQGQSGNPWLRMQMAYSGSDDNPDALQFFSTTSSGAGSQSIKTGWLNGNGEGRFAPSATNRVAFRVFEAYENRGGPSTNRVFEVSTNPTVAANREPLLSVYGTGHSTQPGWAVATRVLAGLLGVRAGGNYNSLTAVAFRGQRATTGAPTSGTWLAGDVVLDSAGQLYLCTASGTPGTWASPTSTAPTAFTAITPGTSMGHGTKTAATRLDRGGEVARLRGTLTASGSVASGSVLATIPTTAHRPLATVTTIARYTGGGTQFQISSAGEITIGNSLTSGQSVWLDSITWDLTS